MLIFTLAEDNHGDIGTFSTVEEALDYIKKFWYVNEIESVNGETEQDAITKEIGDCENGLQTIEINTNNGLYYISSSEVDIMPKTVCVIMTDDGDCVAIRADHNAALRAIFERGCGDDWREEYGVDTEEEMLEYIDGKRSFCGMFIIECDDCQI